MPIPEKHFTRRGMLAVTAAAAAGLAVEACSSSSSSPGAAKVSPAVSQAEISKAMKTPTTLTFWTWVPDISKEVAVFERQYPAIKINVVNPGQGTPLYTKLHTALDAGKGTPDLAQIEYQYIPTFAILKAFVDLRPYGAAANAGKFVDWVWRQVTGPSGEIYAYPQDTGPMGMLYREDIFAAHGISVPATWDDFATAARKLHSADSGIYLTNMADNEVAAWHGLMWQAGFRPYTVKGTNIGLALDDPASKKVASYWGGLVSEGVISTDPDFTSNWYQGLDTGKYASWLTGAWGPAFLAGAIKSTAGKWRAAPLPQWSSGQQVAGNWGGSTNAVIKGTHYPIAAAKFAEFLNTNPQTTAMFNTQQSLFPSLKSLLASTSFSSYKSAFFGGQQANKLFAQISATVNVNWQWPPFLDQSITDWTDTVGKALGSKANVAAATTSWDSQLAAYARAQGSMSRPADQVRDFRLAGGSPVPESSAPPRGRWRAGMRRGRYGYVFALPFLACFAVLFVLPLGYALYLSLFRTQLVGGTVFAGLANYAQAFTDGQFIAGVGRVALFFIMQVPIMLLLALLAALAIDSGLLRLARLTRLGIFIPYAVPGVVAALMWGYLYGPDFGPAAQLAARLHVTAPDFLGRTLMLPSIANIVTWEFTGYNMIVLYAALRTVPRELCEAASVDGAGPWRIAWRIKVPALRPALLLCLMFSVIGSFQLFTEPDLLQSVAPTVIGPSYTPNLYAYSLAFTSQEPDYAAAVSFLLGLVTVIISYAVLYAASRRSRR